MLVDAQPGVFAGWPFDAELDPDDLHLRTGWQHTG
jgi:hypothetical protein